MFLAMTFWPGCLPDTAEDLPTFDTAAEAWRYLVDGLGEGQWVPENEDDPEGPHRLSDLAIALEERERLAESEVGHDCGTVQDADGYCFSVEYADANA